MTADPGAIRLETYQMVLLRHTAGGRSLPPERAEQIFREHLAYTLNLVSSGQQLCAGPVRDSPAEEEDICGFGLFQQDSVGTVRKLLEGDPGVRQGLYTFDVMVWQTPAGSVSFPAQAGTVRGLAGDRGGS